MMLDPNQCYKAVLTRDLRFDGRFFVAVKTTKIYCRPICRVKPPLRKNCLFFNYAATAEAARFRPCKRCRPELAPGNSLMEVSSQLARQIAILINQDYLADHSLNDLACKLGVSNRQMRRVFAEEFGVAPIEFWQTQRLLLAKQLLTDSKMPVTEVALASGFKSLRRFNTLLKERYHLTPTELRKLQKKGLTRDFAEFSFRLSYRPPFNWESILNFLALRAIPNVELVQEGFYRRTVCIKRNAKNLTGYIEVSQEAGSNVLSVRLSSELLPVCAIILERVKQLFDLSADPVVIDLTLESLAKRMPGLRVPGSFDGFEVSVRAILGQQVSVAAASTLAGRLASKFGIKLSTPFSSLNIIFPSAERLALCSISEFTKLGITSKRAETLIALSQVVVKGNLHLGPGNRIEETLKELQNIPGIGEWTAQYIAMRALSWPDAFPHTDLGIKKALKTKNTKKILVLAEKWRPWRAYAALHLWHNGGNYEIIHNT